MSGGPAWFKTAAANASVRPCRAPGTLPMRMSFASESNFGESKKSKFYHQCKQPVGDIILFFYQTNWYVHHHQHKKPSINLGPLETTIATNAAAVCWVAIVPGSMTWSKKFQKIRYWSLVATPQKQWFRSLGFCPEVLASFLVKF